MPLPDVAIPESLRDLAKGETRPLDEERLTKRLRAAWVTSIELYPGEGFNGVVLWFGPFYIAIDNVWQGSTSPVADALDEAVELAAKYDLLRRLHSAFVDMTQVRWAAEALLESHSAGWRWWWRWERLRKSAAVHRLSTIHEVIETGMVTMYARHFTGDRQLPEKWWPKGRRQPTHKLLVDRRMNVAAHADDTAERGLINPNALHGMPGSFVMEFRRPLMEAELREVEHHAACMTARYSDGVLALKRELGIAAYGDPIGEGAYDE